MFGPGSTLGLWTIKSLIPGHASGVKQCGNLVQWTIPGIYAGDRSEDSE